MDGISAPLDACEKIWLIFPPTDGNLSLMDRERGQQAKLSRIGTELEGGIIERTTSAEALYLPAACLHAVFTVAGGFLVSIDCTTRSSVWSFSKYLRYQLHLELDDVGQQECYSMFLRCLEVSLANSYIDLAIRSWVSIEDILHQHADTSDQWLHAAITLWQPYIDSDTASRCPCRSPRLTPMHRFATHLWWLPGGRS